MIGSLNKIRLITIIINKKVKLFHILAEILKRERKLV